MSAVIFLVFSLWTVAADNSLDDIINTRNKLLENELDMMLGSDVELSDSEIIANEIVMDLKIKELDYGFNHPKMFNLSKHFFDYKDAVKETDLFKIIHMMPKGALLHAHDTGILGPDYVLKLTYEDDLYVCFDENDVHFLFSKRLPDTTCPTRWQLLRDARYSSGDVEKFDANLRRHFTIVVDKPKDIYTDVNTVWSKFQGCFVTSSPIMTYKPIWERYFYDTLKALREDNVMYLELRSVLPPLYDLDGNVYDSVATAEITKRVVDEFLNDYPDFFGAKLIYAPIRMVDVKTVQEYIRIAKEIKNKMPDFFAGFDLVGQEDLGTPIKEFLPVLYEAGNNLDYFFHAGETNWYGTSSDENLVDAIVLGSKRIGHAFALVKHPLLLQEVKKRNIALEINVISNSVLKLVDDVRNHPLAVFLASDLPVVLSSDDPGIWEAESLSHDFYLAFLGVASRHADLRLLKKLALNSLYYSTSSMKDKLVHEFEIRWTKFISNIVRKQW